MGLKAFAAKILAGKEHRKVQSWAQNPIDAQDKTFRRLVEVISQTGFGKEHGISSQTSLDAWSTQIPLRDYEQLKPWVERIQNGEENVLWTGKPRYFCKTSGTTSGTKYIPMTEEGINAQTKAARSALLLYIHESGNASFSEGKMIFLQGSPELSDHNGISTGRLSGIVAHHVPSYLLRNRMPSLKVNMIDDWETKVDEVVEETMNEDMRLISGIPPWIQMYYEKLLARSGKSTIKELYPNLSVFAHGGVNYEPYKSSIERLTGPGVDTIETYPASEGFIAFQDSQKEEGMLLNLDAGIFYEFISLDKIHDENPERLTLKDVEVGKNYAIVLNTSSGLWGYLIGDTVKFVSTEPYRIVVSGRIKHFISAFGEHVIAEEVEKAMTEVAQSLEVEINEFHVAPQVNPEDGLPYHEWFVETSKDVGGEFAVQLDAKMCELNSYYKDLIEGSVLRSLIITHVNSGAFNAYMESIGKLGGQNKLPRLANDRKIADSLFKFKVG